MTIFEILIVAVAVSFYQMRLTDNHRDALRQSNWAITAWRYFILILAGAFWIMALQQVTVGHCWVDKLIQ